MAALDRESCKQQHMSMDALCLFTELTGSSHGGTLVRMPESRRSQYLPLLQLYAFDTDPGGAVHVKTQFLRSPCADIDDAVS